MRCIERVLQERVLVGLPDGVTPAGSLCFAGVLFDRSVLRAGPSIRTAQPETTRVPLMY